MCNPTYHCNWRHILYFGPPKTVLLDFAKAIDTVPHGYWSWSDQAKIKALLTTESKPGLLIDPSVVLAR